MVVIIVEIYMSEKRTFSFFFCDVLKNQEQNQGENKKEEEEIEESNIE